MKYPNQRARTEAKKQVAEELNVSLSTVNRMKICEKPLESVEIRKEKAEKARKHKEMCKKYAQKVINREIRAKEAAALCGLSMRQMHRWISSLTTADAGEPDGT